MTAVPETDGSLTKETDRTAVKRSLTALLAGEGIGWVGSCVHRMALPVLAVLHLRADPGQLALLAFAAEVPMLVVALPAGAMADRYALRTILISTDVAAAAVVSLIPAAAVLDVLTMPLLYAVGFVLGSLHTLHMAASMAAIPLLADGARRRHEANARFTEVITISGAAGTALGTALVAAVGAAQAILADALSYLVSAWCATRIRALPVPDRKREVRLAVVGQIREGVGFSAHNPLLRALFVALTAPGVSTGLIASLLSYLLLITVQVGTTGLGLVMAASSLGGLTGARLAPRLVRRCKPGPVLAYAWTVYPLMQIPLLVARPGITWLAVLIVGAFGQFAAATCVGTTQRSLQQSVSPPHLQARVQQTALWLHGGGRALAALAAGILATLTSVRTVMLIGIVILLMSAWALHRSPVRRLNAMDGAAP
ncbi:MFS transporter [Streptomyces sp. NBC_01601]|uniref:MFS transporter n=1 Tax=Streptomyces sp. NBC_01601 TaxID=2975892 RepID=UPI002E2CA699|nr:MFS transporter [Streptomyces sp. NBC_01601]